MAAIIQLRQKYITRQYQVKQRVTHNTRKISDSCLPVENEHKLVDFTKTANFEGVMEIKNSFRKWKTSEKYLAEIQKE